MLFCFGLFALLLYNTVVANAECSYTYRNSSQQHIEAQSTDYERQGFRRCEFLIQLGDPQQQIELNFTRLSGFGISTGRARGPGRSSNTSRPEDGRVSSQQETGTSWEDEEVEEEEKGEHQPPSSGKIRGGGGRGEGEEEGSQTDGGKKGFSWQVLSSSSSTTTTSSPATIVSGEGSKLSSMVSSSSYAPRESSQHSTHNTHAYAGNGNFSMVETPPRTPAVAGGGKLGGRGEDDASCLPVVEIREVSREGEERIMHRICHQFHNTQTPIVFHYASSVRIVYEWKRRQSSGFTLYFDFSSKKCVHKCDGSRCLTEAGLLCNGQADCSDRSDEATPACALSTSDSMEAGHLVQVVVIPTTLGVIGFVVCVVCFLARHHHRHRYSHHHRRWSSSPSSPSLRGGESPNTATTTTPTSFPSDSHPHHLLSSHHHLYHPHHHHQQQQQHLLRGNGHVTTTAGAAASTAVHFEDCPQSLSSEGLTPSSSLDCSNEQTAALLPNATQHPHRSHHHKHHHSAWHPPHPPQAPLLPPATTPLKASDPPEVGGGLLPPNIPVSPDGEEGYSASQLRLLLDRRSHPASELFKPPPNKTVFDRESPPPYSLTPSSVGGNCCGSLAPPPSPPQGYLWPERVVRDIQGQPVVSRCYTMFSGPTRPSRGGGDGLRIQQGGMPREGQQRYHYQQPWRCVEMNIDGGSDSAVVASTDCDSTVLESSTSSASLSTLPPSPRLFGALTTTAMTTITSAGSEEVLRPTLPPYHQPSTSSSSLPHHPPEYHHHSSSQPSETIVLSPPGWSSLLPPPPPSLVVVGSGGGGNGFVRVNTDCVPPFRPAGAAPPNYQTVLSQDWSRGERCGGSECKVGGRGWRGSPNRGAFSVPPSSSSHTSSSSSFSSSLSSATSTATTITPSCSSTCAANATTTTTTTTTSTITTSANSINSGDSTGV